MILMKRNNEMVRRITLTLVSTALIFGAGWMAYGPAAPQKVYGQVFETPRPAYDFVLPSTTGERVRLHESRGKVTLIFFGYTSCPDICPTTLADVKQAVAQLGRQADEVQLLFITVDPARDTLARLTEYLGYFHAGYIGLRDDPITTTAIARQFGARFYREEGTAAQGSYSVAHTADLMLIDRDGNWVMAIPHGTAVDEMASTLRYWLGQ
jgi:protein SCO1/2